MALALVGMPVKVLSETTIAAILSGGAEVCASAGIPIAGGHTIDSVEPIYGLVVLGLVHPDQVKTNAGARPGDMLVLGKPLGVGILSAALKAGDLDAQGYGRMIDTVTRLNTPGAGLAALPGVHAMTDVTGFGLGGHGLEMARGAGCDVEIRWADVPLLAGARELAAAGRVTGASGRNWDSYGADIALPEGFAPVDRALLTDPQTSGGLLVACAPAAVDQVMSAFATGGFAQAATVGRITDPTGQPRLRIV